MELFTLVWQFLLLWACIYTIVFTLQFLSTRRRIPAHKTRRQHGSTLLPMAIVDDASDDPLERDQWSIKLFQVKYTTQRLNKFFHYLTKLAPNFWNYWFAIGVLVSAVTMFVGMGVIVYAGTKILYSFSTVFSSSHTNGFSKRGLDQGQGDDQVFLPMVKYVYTCHLCMKILSIG